MPPDTEPRITVNGVTLTTGQAMTLRVALGAFALDLQAHGLGDDGHGEAMTKAYLARIAELHRLMQVTGADDDAA